MKRIIVSAVFLLAAYAAFGQRLSTVAVLPPETAAAGPIGEQYAKELAGLEMATIIPPSQAASLGGAPFTQDGDWKDTDKIKSLGKKMGVQYFVRLRVEGQTVRAETYSATSGKVLSQVKEPLTGGKPDYYSLCVKTMEYVPYPNYMIGKWTSSITLADGVLRCILQFKADGTVIAETFDTYEKHNGNAGESSLTYYGYGAGTYTFGGHIRRNVSVKGANGKNSQIPADGSFNITLKLDNALTKYGNLNGSRIYLTFGDGRSSFELPAGGIACGEGLAFTSFTKVSGSAKLPAASGGNFKPAPNPVSITPLWQHELKGTVTGVPYLQAESAVLNLEEGGVVSYSRQGNNLWDFNARGTLSPYVSRSVEASVYVCNTEGLFLSINRVGRELWNLQLDKPITAAVVSGWDGRVFIPTGSAMRCMTESGIALWSKDIGGNMALPPAIDRTGGLVTVLENRNFTLIDPFGGIESLALDRMPASIVSLKHGQDYFYLVFYTDGKLDRVDYKFPGYPADVSRPKGGKLSRTALPALPEPAAAAERYNGQAAVVLQDGKLLLLDGASGKTLWNGPTHESTSEKGSGRMTPEASSVTFDERGIFVFSPSGVTAYNAEGRRLWVFRNREGKTLPSFSDEGILYSPGAGHSIIAYQLEDRARNLPHSLYGPQPEGSYGLGNPPPPFFASPTEKYNPTNVTGMYNRIEKAVREGQVGEHETEYVGYLMDLTAGILSLPNYSPVRPPVLPNDRVKFLHLLSMMSSRETIKFYINLLNRDPEPSIKAACCESIGRIGVDPSGEALYAFNVLIAPDNPGRDPQTLIAAVSATAKLAYFSGPPLSQPGTRLLNRFTSRDLPFTVREQAKKELDALRKLGISK